MTPCLPRRAWQDEPEPEETYDEDRPRTATERAAFIERHEIHEAVGLAWVREERTHG